MIDSNIDPFVFGDLLSFLDLEVYNLHQKSIHFSAHFLSPSFPGIVILNSLTVSHKPRLCPHYFPALSSWVGSDSVQCYTFWHTNLFCNVSHSSYYGSNKKCPPQTCAWTLGPQGNTVCGAPGNAEQVSVVTEVGSLGQAVSVVDEPQARPGFLLPDSSWCEDAAPQVPTATAKLS